MLDSDKLCGCLNNFEKLRWRKNKTSTGSEHHLNKNQRLARDVPQKQNIIQANLSKNNSKRNLNRFYVFLWIWSDILDFEVRFWIWGNFGIWTWILIWASTKNVISRISSCEKSVAGIWLTKSLQIHESCMISGARLAKGGPLGRVW